MSSLFSSDWSLISLEKLRARVSWNATTAWSAVLLHTKSISKRESSHCCYTISGVWAGSSDKGHFGRPVFFLVPLSFAEPATSHRSWRRKDLIIPIGREAPVSNFNFSNPRCRFGAQMLDLITVLHMRERGAGEMSSCRSKVSNSGSKPDAVLSTSWICVSLRGSTPASSSNLKLTPSFTSNSAVRGVLLLSTCSSLSTHPCRINNDTKFFWAFKIAWCNAV